MSQREEMIRQKIADEQAEVLRDLGSIRHAMLDFFINFKGFRPDEIEVDRKFELSCGDNKEAVSLDFIVNLEGRLFMAVKCAASSIESYDRHVLSFSRVVGPYQIPFCLVTDGIAALFLDTATGKTLSSNLNAVPTRDEALRLIEGDIFKEYPSQRLEMEKRILMAFNGLSCPIN